MFRRDEFLLRFARLSDCNAALKVLNVFQSWTRLGGPHDGFDGAVAGETFDVYVYQGDDTNPANGAALVGSAKTISVAAPLASLQTITLPGGGFQLGGPGDGLIALVYKGTQDGRRLHNRVAQNRPVLADHPLASAAAPSSAASRVRRHALQWQV